ncbi:MAG: hypothetical protein WCC53_11920 [Thermoanaerobaculia bacterium]
MRYRIGMIALIGVAGLCAGPSLLACGDKFLVAGRGARFQREGARSTIVIYAPLSSTLRGGPGNLSVDAVLSRAGYHPAVVASAEELSRILKDGNPGIVLVDIADARTVEKLVPAGAPGPVIVPVLPSASRQEVAAARKTWGVALKSPASGDSLLDAVDEAVDRHAKAQKAANSKL